MPGIHRLAAASVAILDIDEGAAHRARDAMARADARAWSADCDIADENQVEDVFARIDRELGRPDVLVNNASINPRMSPLDSAWRMWKKVLGSTSRGYFLCSRTGRRMVVRGGGAIGNVGSVTLPTCRRSMKPSHPCPTVTVASMSTVTRPASSTSTRYTTSPRTSGGGHSQSTPSRYVSPLRQASRECLNGGRQHHQHILGARHPHDVVRHGRDRRRDTFRCGLGSAGKIARAVVFWPRQLRLYRAPLIADGGMLGLLMQAVHSKPSDD